MDVYLCITFILCLHLLVFHNFQIAEFVKINNRTLGTQMLAGTKEVVKSHG